jgi:hypothetical protein
MFDEFIMDEEAYDYLKESKNRPWLGQWPELISALNSEGSLMLADVRAAGKQQMHRRGALLRRDLDRPHRWNEAMAHYNALTSLADRMLGEKPWEAQDLSWRFDPDDTFGVAGPDNKSHSLSAVLQGGASSELHAHRQLYFRAINALKAQLREVNSCLVACDELCAAPMMWAPYRHYLKEKLSDSDQESTMTGQTAGTDFFQIAFPAYAPTTVSAFSRLRSHKSIKALRKEILRAAQYGDVMDPRYPQRILTEVLNLEQKAGRMRRISGWISSAVGMIPIPGLGIFSTIVSEAISKSLERKWKKPWHWFYLISDGRGGT